VLCGGGYILLPIFRVNSPALVVIYMVIMILFAAAEAVGRPVYSYKGLYWHSAQSVGVGAVLCGVFGLAGLFRVGLDAQYAIPIFGMLLGNTLTGISVSMNTVITGIAEDRDTVEKFLCFGATRWEATSLLRRRAFNVGITPSVNQASVAGLVAIPGMMTGQLLAGTDPAQAARYQILLLFLIVSCCGIGIFSISYLVIVTIFDRRDRLQIDRILPGRKGLSSTIADQFDMVASLLQMWLRRRSNQEQGESLFR